MLQVILVYEPENTAIIRWHHVSILSPQRMILRQLSLQKRLFLAGNRYLSYCNGFNGRCEWLDFIKTQTVRGMWSQSMPDKYTLYWFLQQMKKHLWWVLRTRRIGLGRQSDQTPRKQSVEPYVHKCAPRVYARFTSEGIAAESSARTRPVQKYIAGLNCGFTIPLYRRVRNDLW